MIQKGIIKLNKISLCVFAFHVKDREKKHKTVICAAVVVVGVRIESSVPQSSWL